MTRANRVTRLPRARTKHPADARGVFAPALMKFISFEDNGGAFHWAIVATSGDRPVQSATFASYTEAKQAAGVVRSGAVSAPFDSPADDPASRVGVDHCPSTLPGRRQLLGVA
jgi:hypothetical protein